MKIFLFGTMFFILLFYGCSITGQNLRTVNKSDSKLQVRTVNNSSNIQRKDSYANQTNVKQIYASKKSYKNIVYNGSIKGIIKNLRYIKNSKVWEYEVKGVDTSNFKLPYAKFRYPKKLAGIGDYVYVILKRSNLVNLFLIKKANIATGKRVPKKKVFKISNTHKRDGSRKNKNISVPQEVQISFD